MKVRRHQPETSEALSDGNTVSNEKKARDVTKVTATAPVKAVVYKGRRKVNLRP